MSVWFEALPVGRGDAFLIRDGDEVFLIDGGQYVNQVTGFLQADGLSRIKVIICTHNDSDHANGLIGLLESSVRVSEVWLPVSYVEFLQTAVAPKEPWPLRLFREVQDLQSDIVSLEDIYKRGEETDRYVYEGDESNDIQLESLMDSWADYEDSELLRPIPSGPYWPVIIHAGVFLEALLAGERVRRLLCLAYERGCVIRFFKYAAQKQISQSPLHGFVPVNAAQVARMRKARSILRLLALTQTNRESLVFRREWNDRASILFTADSDLKFLKATPIRLPKTSIVTAPHHGSADNAMAYSLVLGENLQWVRSDMKTIRRPCPEFRQQSIRFCTICPHGNGSRQRVKLRLARGLWKPTSSTRACECH
jgi:hypothetical protein